MANLSPSINRRSKLFIGLSRNLKKQLSHITDYPFWVLDFLAGRTRKTK